MWNGTVDRDLCEPCRNIVYSRLTRLFVTEQEPGSRHLHIVQTPETKETVTTFLHQTSRENL